MNNLQPGDKLPSERDMAAMLKTSRNSVREALRILEDRGSIYVKTGSGVFINTPVHSVPRFPSLFFIGTPLFWAIYLPTAPVSFLGTHGRFHRP